MVRSIKEILDKIKSFLADERAFTSLLILSVGLASFGLGRLSVQYEGQNRVRIIEERERPMTIEQQVRPAVEGATEGMYVGSKKSDKYHLPWCPGALNISETNRIWFKDEAAARAAGYKPAGNCKGI